MYTSTLFYDFIQVSNEFVTIDFFFSFFFFVRYDQKYFGFMKLLSIWSEIYIFFLFVTALLHLAPNSPDAKVFEDFANSAKNGNSTTSAPAPGN